MASLPYIPELRQVNYPALLFKALPRGRRVAFRWAPEDPQLPFLYTRSLFIALKKKLLIFFVYARERRCTHSFSHPHLFGFFFKCMLMKNLIFVYNCFITIDKAALLLLKIH